MKIFPSKKRFLSDLGWVVQMIWTTFCLFIVIVLVIVAANSMMDEMPGIMLIICGLVALVWAGYIVDKSGK